MATATTSAVLPVRPRLCECVCACVCGCVLSCCECVCVCECVWMCACLRACTTRTGAAVPAAPTAVLRRARVCFLCPTLLARACVRVQLLRLLPPTARHSGLGCARACASKCSAGRVRCRMCACAWLCVLLVLALPRRDHCCLRRNVHCHHDRHRRARRGDWHGRCIDDDAAADDDGDVRPDGVDEGGEDVCASWAVWTCRRACVYVRACVRSCMRVCVHPPTGTWRVCARLHCGCPH